MWPALQTRLRGAEPASGNNVIRHCTGQLTFLANGGAIYGGADNRIETVSLPTSPLDAAF